METTRLLFPWVLYFTLFSNAYYALMAETSGLDGDSSGRDEIEDEMATQDRMLIQIAVKDPHQVDIIVTRIGEAQWEAAAPEQETVAVEGEIGKDTLYARETPYNEDFPSSLGLFGYCLLGGRLLNLDTGEPFVFDAKPGDHDYNQRRYNALGEVMSEVVYGELEWEFKMERIPVPKDNAARLAVISFIFVSPGALRDRDKLMILIHGAGGVRAGQWSRQLLINEGTESGSQMPFIAQAIKEGYGVVVLNTNRNLVHLDGVYCEIPGSSTPIEHACTVWKDYILTSPARQIYIVAHSYGGTVTLEMMRMFFEDFRNRVHKIAFTDSGLAIRRSPGESQWLMQHARNWVCSDQPLDTVLSPDSGGVPRVSAGTDVHERTSHSALHSIFAYFNQTATSQ